MQPSTTRLPQPSGWPPSPGSWEEAVLSWYEQAELFTPRKPGRRISAPSPSDGRGQPPPDNKARR